DARPAVHVGFISRNPRRDKPQVARARVRPKARTIARFAALPEVPVPITLVHAAQIVEGFAADDRPLIHADAALAIDDGRVVAIAPLAEMRQRYPAAGVLGGARFVAIPGLINAHHHVGTTPLQLGSPDLPLELWFASRLGLRDVDFHLDTLYSAFEMIESGV